MMTHILIGLAVVVAWLLSLNAKPFGKCPLCRGKGFRLRVRKKGRKTKARGRKCLLCKGKGRRQRLGSRTVHRVRRRVVAGWQDRKEGA